MAKKKDDLTFDVKKKIGQLDSDSKYPKELRKVSWNNAAPKWDVRSWGQDKDGSERPFSGITFDTEELISLRDLIDKALESEDE